MSKTVIDLGVETTIEVKFGGQTYSLREPKFKDVEKLQKDSEGKEQGEAKEVFMTFLADLGMPKKVLEEMGIITMKKLSDGLMGAFEGKK